MGKAIDLGLYTSMDQIPQPVSIITGANLRRADDGLASLLGEVLATEARLQGKAPPAEGEVEEFLGLMLARPVEAAGDTKAPPTAGRGRGRGRTRRSRRR
jgi:hypothetical protein